MRGFVFTFDRRHASALGILVTALTWSGLAATPANPQDRGVACATVPAAERAARTRLESFFAAITAHEWVLNQYVFLSLGRQI